LQGPGLLLVEGDMHARFDHPNIVRMYGWIVPSDDSSSNYGLCMELVEGGSLGGMLRLWR